jgi:hypothetical protein
LFFWDLVLASALVWSVKPGAQVLVTSTFNWCCFGATSICKNQNLKQNLQKKSLNTSLGSLGKQPEMFRKVKKYANF